MVETRLPSVMVPGGGQKLDEWLAARTLVRSAGHYRGLPEPGPR